MVTAPPCPSVGVERSSGPFDTHALASRVLGRSSVLHPGSPHLSTGPWWGDNPLPPPFPDEHTGLLPSTRAALNCAALNDFLLLPRPQSTLYYIVIPPCLSVRVFGAGSQILCVLSTFYQKEKCYATTVKKKMEKKNVANSLLTTFQKQMNIGILCSCCFLSVADLLLTILIPVVNLRVPDSSASGYMLLQGRQLIKMNDECWDVSLTNCNCGEAKWDQQ